MYWKEKKINEFTSDEWEALCDGCGKCCLLKLEDPDTMEVAYTACACSLLDIEKVTCKQYSSRFLVVPECLKIKPENIMDLNYLPNTCAYKLIAQGKDLPDWHHLNCGNKELVHNLGKSVRDWCVPIENVPEEDWVDLIIEIED
ncbi:hypothetical protein A9Q84_13415 [Halobacteriovorax marinus]|uniref:Uncharacterized protein n=1 Tax=Halobacteriovorax marinus TaxID=97084 RepID=A0A1Y5F8U9_9BACT|nr:hypothetical protein A9Q84_13415 [Halobacteriovorax marinus]